MDGTGVVDRDRALGRRAVNGGFRRQLGDRVVLASGAALAGHVRVGDGARYVRETEDRFDICIIDSTDPYLDEDPSSVATPLAQPEFYEGLRRVIGERGIASQILGHHYFYPDVYPLLIRELRDQWRQVEIALVAVPFYISGRWSLGIYSQTPFKPMEPRPCETECDWYNADVHRAAFCHPNDLKRFLARLDES